MGSSQLIYFSLEVGVNIYCHLIYLVLEINFKNQNANLFGFNSIGGN